MSEVVYGEGFNASTATEAQIMERALLLRGKTLRELAGSSRTVAERAPGDKGLVGQVVERFFSIAQNAASAPDFAGAGIELKVVPLKAVTRPKRGLRVKERTSVTMISYHELIEETWKDASVRKKLESILFVFYHHLPTGDPLDYPIEDVILWSPSEELNSQFQRDWTVVRDKVDDGRAHEVSERDGRVLGAATKGAGGSFTGQPNSSVPAKPRAWALKPSLTTWILETLGAKPVVEESLTVALQLSPEQDFEAAALSRLHGAAGRELDELARRLGVPLSSAKSGAATIVRRLLGLVNDKVSVREFEQQGILVKTVPVSEDGATVFESMSFPRFEHMKVIDETWEDSDLRSHLQRLLIVPLVRRSRREPRGANRLGMAFLWSPSDQELEAIESEWERFVELIRTGAADRLPTAASTSYIHVRPKGRDSTDTEPAPGIHRIMKKCFWLNSEYVKSIIAANLRDGVLPRVD